MWLFLNQTYRRHIFGVIFTGLVGGLGPVNLLGSGFFLAGFLFLPLASCLVLLRAEREEILESSMAAWTVLEK